MSTTIPAFTNTLGPLPTAWALPASCTTGLAANNHEAWLHQSCVGSNFERNPSCWPPRTEGAASLSSALSTWGIYSPGTACPSGMISACGFDGSMNTGAYQFYFPPGPSETAIGCCPSSVLIRFRFNLSPFLLSGNIVCRRLANQFTGSCAEGSFVTPSRNARCPFPHQQYLQRNVQAEEPST